MEYLLTYSLVFFAAIMNAVMDRCENLVAFNRSIFNHLDAKFWCKEVSWQYAMKVFGWKADSWHIAKSAMIFLLIGLVFFQLEWWNYILLGVTWNVTFTFFYHKVLYR